MLDRMALNTFARRMGFKNGKAYGFKGHLHALERMKVIEIHQGGYLADSMHHQKIVTIKNAWVVAAHFNLPAIPSKPLPNWKREKKCRHGGFSEVAAVDTRFTADKTIRKVILKCGRCAFCLVGVEVDGVMKEARPL
jgi:hypothetical protein